MTPRCWAWTSKKGVTVPGDEKTPCEELWLRCPIWHPKETLNMESGIQDRRLGWRCKCRGYQHVDDTESQESGWYDHRSEFRQRSEEVCVSTWSPPTLEVKAWGTHKGVGAEAAKEVGGPGEKSLLVARYLHRSVKEGRRGHLHQMPRVDTTRMKNWPLRCNNAKIVGDFRRSWDRKTWLK